MRRQAIGGSELKISGHEPCDASRVRRRQEQPRIVNNRSEIDCDTAAKRRHHSVRRRGHQHELTGLKIEIDAVFPFDVTGSFDVCGK